MKKDNWKPAAFDREHMERSLIEQLGRHNDQWVAIRFRDMGWEIVKPRSHEAIVAACDTVEPDTREGFAAGIEAAAKVADSAAFDGYRNAAAANYRAPENERLVRWTAQNIAASIRDLAKETTDG